MTPIELAIAAFGGRVPPGARIAYYTGNLAHDCCHSPELRRLRGLAWAASEAGEVELSQERVDDGGCRYWARGLSEGLAQVIRREKAEKAEKASKRRVRAA
jgi:hypothetical protein